MLVTISSEFRLHTNGNKCLEVHTHAHTHTNTHTLHRLLITELTLPSGTDVFEEFQSMLSCQDKMKVRICKDGVISIL